MHSSNTVALPKFQSESLSPYQSFKKAYNLKLLLKKYVNTTNIHGYKRTNMQGYSKADRILWIFLMIMFIIAASWLIINSYVAFLNAPTATTQQPVRTAISEVPFPAVAVCAGNRLSRSALLEMSKKMFMLQKNTVTKIGNNISEIFDSLLLFGSFYDLVLDENNFYDIDKLHSFLVELYNGEYPINDIMANLSVPCSKLLIRCKLFNEFVNCSDIFQTRKTYLGQCCIFNYERPRLDSVDLRNKIQKFPNPKYFYVNGSGLKNGLSVVIDQSLEDMSYKILNSITAKVLLFDTMDYPDFISSAISEKYIRVNRDSTITVNPIIVEADASMKYFPPSARKCLFSDESNLEIKNHYSYSECLLTCRMKDMIDFCGCIPPYMAIVVEGSYCLFKDIPCLARWREKWFNFEPLITLTENMQKFLQCPECLTRCHYIKYKLQNSWIEINAPSSHNGTYMEGILQNFTRDDFSIINIYFHKDYVYKYVQNVVYNWYELLSYLGGICGLVFGASVISMVELIYFLTGRFFVTRFETKHIKKNNLASMRAKHNISQENMDSNSHLIYWNELVQPKQFVINRF